MNEPGEIQIRFIPTDKYVIISLPGPMAWLTLDFEQARTIGNQLIDMANEIERRQPKKI